MKKLLFILFLFFLTGCSNNVTDDFSGKVFNHTENPSRQISFIDDGVLISPAESIKPNMSDEDLEEVSNNAEDYEAREYQNIEIQEVSANEYEVIEDNEKVFSFIYNEDNNTLEVDGELYNEQITN